MPLAANKSQLLPRLDSSRVDTYGDISYHAVSLVNSIDRDDRYDGVVSSFSVLRENGVIGIRSPIDLGM